MKFDKIKRLKSRIKELQKDNEFLQRGIDSREEAYNFVSEQLDKAMALQQELTFLLIYLEAIENLLKDDFSSNAKTIRRAIGKFKAELIDGFSSNHFTTLPNKNKLDNNTNNNITNEK